ncbi:MAG: hypothetical protein AAFO29_23115 [Actinomycetota bacterium]
MNMTNTARTHPPTDQGRSRPWYESRISTPELLSTTWIAVLFADVLRGVHETLRPGFVRELADQGTVYGNEVTDAELAVYGVVLGYLSLVVLLSRVLPRQWNRVANVAASLMMMSGVLLSWPKDPDDLIFGSVQLAGAVIALAICVRWTQDRPPTTRRAD